MRIATIPVEKEHLTGALLAARFCVVVVSEMPVDCDPAWLYLQITEEDLPKESN